MYSHCFLPTFVLNQTQMPTCTLELLLVAVHVHHVHSGYEETPY